MTTTPGALVGSAVDRIIHALHNGGVGGAWSLVKLDQPNNPDFIVMRFAVGATFHGDQADPDDTRERVTVTVSRQRPKNAETKVEVELPGMPGEPGPTGTLVDSPEVRAVLEAHAIPGCRTWREANPEIDPAKPCCGGALLAGSCRRCGSFDATPLECPACGYGKPGDRASISVVYDGHEPYCVEPATVPAPYCCSSYCPRCAGLRALDGVDPLLPNDWMFE